MVHLPQNRPKKVHLGTFWGEKIFGAKRQNENSDLWGAPRTPPPGPEPVAGGGESRHEGLAEPPSLPRNNSLHPARWHTVTPQNGLGQMRTGRLGVPWFSGKRLWGGTVAGVACQAGGGPSGTVSGRGGLTDTSNQLMPTCAF